MTKKSLIFYIIMIIGGYFGVSWAADHIDAPGVSSTSSDITDFYAFQSPENNDNMVFVCNLMGLMDPTATAAANFDEQVMIEFNIDNDGNNVEDLVIQAIFKDGQVTVYGPVAPSTTGLTSGVEVTGTTTSTAISTYNGTVNIGNENGIKVFAGPRDDPFFMDFAQFGEILAGNATGFNNPGSDTFAGTNVLSVVVEVPKSSLGGTDSINTWVESKRKI